jgi:NAD(P)-dependent dehydrogenase (short-subunit alcohol dehydrogenase family)
MHKDFSGRIAVVAGGSRGIGRGIAEALAREGAELALVSSSEANLAAAAAVIEDGGSAPPFTCAADLRRPEDCRRVFDSVESRFGRCDILVNSAGATRAGSFLELSEEVWQDGFALKFFGCVRLCRLFWPLLKEAGGHVVNVVGGAARSPDPEFLVGGAVNAAMANFTKGLAGLGKRDGVNVNAIYPGLTETERVEQLFRQRGEASGLTPEQVRAEAVAKEGLRRLGRPEDVAALAVFLCSERARHIQGTAIAVDGGATQGLY